MEFIDFAVDFGFSCLEVISYMLVNYFTGFDHSFICVYISSKIASLIWGLVDMKGKMS